ncbi:MAG: class IV adenylate cyclase [Planctomycetota bacterium]
MPIEVEQKYRIDDANAVLAALARIGAQSQHVVHQIDTYYSHPNRDFAATDEALRIRRVGESNFITYKGPKLDATTKTRREVELPLASGAASAEGYDELLDALSFRRVAEVSKIRQIYQLVRDSAAIEVSLDQVRDVGDFIEIEIVVDNESEIASAQTLLAALADELPLASAERRSYLELLLGPQ